VLAAKLGDPKPQVQAAAMRCLRRLMGAAGPQPVLDLLAPLAVSCGGGGEGGGGGSVAGALVREHVLNAHTMVGDANQNPLFQTLGVYPVEMQSNRGHFLESCKAAPS
jgi:hypothetical protein